MTLSKEQSAHKFCLLLVFFSFAAIAAESGATEVKVTRLENNPLITVATSASLGNNINGPSVIRVPEWVKNPLGRYYMYFAHHKGESIRLAYADSITGPWVVYEPGVLNVSETEFFRPQPDPEGLGYTHIASPEIYIDHTRMRLVMWFHGVWSDDQPFPSNMTEIPKAIEWFRKNGYGQFTQAAESKDGLQFDIHPAITKASYLRVFRYGEHYYSVARLGKLLRSQDLLGSFESGPNLFRDGAHVNPVRHVGITRKGKTLYVFFSASGDSPERILMSTVDLSGDWKDWHASAPVEILHPEAGYECADLALAPSEMGSAQGPVRQLRDPEVFEDNGNAYLFYSICGEQGIAAAKLVLPAR